MPRPRTDRGSASGPRFPVAALFVASISEYWDLAAECYDIQRDATTYRGTFPVVAHPPCRSWSRMRAFSKAPPEERELAGFAVETVRRCGGVLEHPSGTAMWDYYGLPRKPGYDAHGGFFLPVSQSWWGHPAEKRTWLYVVGLRATALPAFDFVTYRAGRVLRNVEDMTSSSRSRTPQPFALWLLQLASACSIRGSEGRTPEGRRGAACGPGGLGLVSMKQL